MTSNLENAFKEINRKFGKGTIQVLGDSRPITTNLLSTGSMLIDAALGGGIGKGRITEIYGVESSGKSTLCLQIAAECQHNGGKVAYIDVENALDPIYAEHLGVNVQDLIFSQPSSAEQALDVVDILAGTGEVDLIIVDSVAALAPQVELDGEMSDMTIGVLARLMAKACRKITGTLNQKNCAVIFINQIREKVATGFSMGPSETTTGGRALRFFASQRIELRKAEAIKQSGEQIGNNVKIKIVKNKIAPPMKVVVVPMIYGDGFSAKDEAIDLSIEYDFIKKSGGWYTTHDGVRMQGKEAVKKYYEEHPELLSELTEMVRSKLLNKDTIKQEFGEDEDDLTFDPATGEVIE